VSDDATATLAVAIAGYIFSMGAFYAWTSGAIKELKKDMNGIGRKVNDDETIAARRYHNISVAMVVCSPADKESEISSLLKEECNQ
jgi:hypothetical protein